MSHRRRRRRRRRRRILISSLVGIGLVVARYLAAQNRVWNDTRMNDHAATVATLAWPTTTVAGTIPPSSAAKSRPSTLVSTPFSDVDNNGSNSKPWIILHVGPPKTATSTLQHELGRMMMTDKMILSRDHIIYAGPTATNATHVRLSQQFRQRHCHAQLGRARWRYQRDDAWRHVPCWHDVVQELRQHYANTSFIISDETLSFVTNQLTLHQMVHPAPLDWISLRDSLAPHYHLLVVIAYRRYAEWLPSAKQQITRYSANKPALTLWPPHPQAKRLRSFAEYYGRTNVSTLPTTAYLYTDAMLQRVAPYMNTRILNIHESTSVRTTFLCQVLPPQVAPQSCAWSRQQDAATTTTTAETMINKGDIGPATYDRIAFEAARQGWIDTARFRRRRVGLALQAFHQACCRNETWHDLPQICPRPVVLASLLNVSVALEQAIVPAFAASSIGVARHQETFWNQTRWTLCGVDAAAVLQRPEWRQFIRQNYGMPRKFAIST